MTLIATAITIGNMTLTSIIILLFIGLVAGWLANLIFKGRHNGLLWNTLIGVAGSFIGGFLFKLVGISFHGIIGSIIAALVGALLLLFVINQLRK